MLGFCLRPLIQFVLFVFIVWFIPWVFVFYTGLLVYFPYDSNGTDRYTRVTGPLVKAFYKESDWTPGEEINRDCRAALIAAEDRNFYKHCGIDLDGIEYAFKKNQRRGKVRSGGSTITQQLVKNAFLSRERSYVRKTREAVGAVLLDRIMTKFDQVTWYFNIVEFGPRTYGIKQAAWKYFRKKPKDLNRSQCVKLVSILPYPKKTYRYLLSGSPPRYLQARQQRILQGVSDHP